MKLTILDLCQRRAGMDDSQPIRSSILMAQCAEEYGYSGYWIAEHHTYDSSNGSPEILMAAIAGCTSKIHVGAGGMLLRYRDPYSIAQAISLLCTLFPSRIELGIARGLIPSPTIQRFQECDVSDCALNAKLIRLVHLLGAPPSESILRPRGSQKPKIWVLGGSAAASSALGNNCNLVIDGMYRLLSPQQAYIESEAVKRAGLERRVALLGACSLTENAAYSAVETYLSRNPNCVLKPCLVGSVQSCKSQLKRWQQETGINHFVVSAIAGTEVDAKTSYECWAELITDK